MARTQIRGNTQILAGSILDAQIGAGAAIATSKLADGADFLQRDGSVAMTGDFDAGSQKIVNLAAPVAASDAARLQDVQVAALGLSVKSAVRVATTVALPANTRTANVITADANGALPSIDGVALSVGQRLLVKNESTAANNGIYTVTDLGDGSSPFVLTRASDADESAEVLPNMFMFVSEGTAQADTGWVLTTNAPITLNTTALDFTQFSGVGAGGDVDSGANVGDAGTGIFKQKSGTTLQFHKLNNVDGKIGIALDGGSDEVRLSIAAASLVNDDISASAAIARSKLAAGSAHRLVVNDASGVMIDAAAITADRALISNANGIPVHSAVTATELGHLSGVTSGIQAQLDDKLEAADIAGLLATGDLVFSEVPTGAIDDVNDEYVLADAPVAGSEQVFHNGQLLRAGSGNDYTISGDTITMEFVPTTGDVIVVHYIVA